MTFMSTATLTEAPVQTISPIAERLNAAMKAQETVERPLGLLDRCDRCPQQRAEAQFVFDFTNEDGTSGTNEIMLCGHHTRLHVVAILEKNPKSFWIEPSLLWKIKGVAVPPRQSRSGGDGLTDAS
jgi:hypothetical protein